MASSLFDISAYSRFNLSESDSDITVLLKEFGYRLKQQFAREEENERNNFPSFAEVKPSEEDLSWQIENDTRFIKDTPNYKLKNLYYLSETGYITSMIYTPDGKDLIVGHSTGLIEMRNGYTGVVDFTLRNIQFPPKPIYALQYSLTEERICYAACADGIVYRIELPNITSSTDAENGYCIRADPAVESLTTQFFGAPGTLTAASPFITQRSPALSLGLSAEHSKLIVGFADASIKVYDVETQEVHNINTFTPACTSGGSHSHQMTIRAGGTVLKYKITTGDNAKAKAVGTMNTTDLSQP